MCWVLTGLCKDKWKEKVSRIKNFETRTSSNQCKKFKRLIQEFNKEYFANNTLKIKKKELHNDESCYERHNHCEITMGLFIINKAETSFLQKTQVSQSQRGQRKSYQILSSQKLILISFGKAVTNSPQKRHVDMVKEVSNFFNLNHNVKREQKSCSSHDNHNWCNRTDGNNSNGGNPLCNKHDAAHKWKDCPQNKHVQDKRRSEAEGYRAI